MDGYLSIVRYIHLQQQVLDFGDNAVSLGGARALKPFLLQVSHAMCTRKLLLMCARCSLPRFKFSS